MSETKHPDEIAPVDGHEAVRIVASTLKRLYPTNPDVVLGREARNIVLDLSANGLLPVVWR